MALPPIPIAGSLVPPTAAAVPPGFTLVDAPLPAGLPQPFPLLGDLTLILAVPTGLATTWRDADPAEVVSRAAAERDPAPPPAGPAAGELGSVRRAPARLFLRQAGAILAAVPLVAGVLRRVPDDGGRDRGELARVVVLDWDLRAGTLLGPGDFGSRIRFAWRAVPRGEDRFEPPPTHPRVAATLQAPTREDV
jgi:hypothetical protein